MSVAVDSAPAALIHEIRIDQYWMAVGPIDMRARLETVLGKVVAVFRSAHAHNTYVITIRRANRNKVPVTERLGVWLAVSD